MSTTIPNNANRTGKTSIVSVELPRELAECLRAKARHNDRSTSGELRRLVRDRFAPTEPPTVERGDG